MCRVYGVYVCESEEESRSCRERGRGREREGGRERLLLIRIGLKHNLVTVAM
jgi:hypothetical protein